MGKINWQRVVLGGLVAGLVLNVVDYVLYGIVLAADFDAALQALGKSGMDMSMVWVFVLLDFAYGIWLVWMYAAIRPRYGAGPRTAVWAGILAWVGVGLFHAIGESTMGLFPSRLYVIGVVVSLVLFPAAVVAGAALYKEEARPMM